MATKEFKTLEEVTIRFAGDSGDGMQLTGTQFTNTAAALGNDLSTLPDYPAEIRAPAGTTVRRERVPDQVRQHGHPHPRRHLRRARRDEPGRACHQLKLLRDGGTIIVNEDAFTDKNLRWPGLHATPWKTIPWTNTRSTASASAS